ncbi:lysophospholipid acyltransferase family protein [Catenulispora subtropica]|uniref:Lysophospholipid acyltransferase family protein n=1 Tax=Catenulispora subtropica TaxID=450798 RepID=A0ABP5DE60_9ACTN
MPSTTPYRPPRKQGPAFRFIAVVMVPLLRLLMKRDWRGGENIPKTGGVVIAANHLSHVDALAFGHFVYGNGRIPRFLAKSGVFKNKFVGSVLRAAQQIPVYRDTADAANALRDAIAAVEAGEAVTVYPEGTITRDPGLWPMAAKSGAARIALTTGCPVIPVAQWGPQEILAYTERRPHLLPRKRMVILAGPPVDLDDLRALPTTPETVKAATDRIMDAITELLAKLRGEEPPAVRFVPENGDGSRFGGGGGNGTGRRNDDGAAVVESGAGADGAGEDEIGKQVDTA